MVFLAEALQLEHYIDEQISHGVLFMFFDEIREELLAEDILTIILYRRLRLANGKSINSNTRGNNWNICIDDYYVYQNKERNTKPPKRNCRGSANRRTKASFIGKTNRNS